MLSKGVCDLLVQVLEWLSLLILNCTWMAILKQLDVYSSPRKVKNLLCNYILIFYLFRSISTWEGRKTWELSMVSSLVFNLQWLTLVVVMFWFPRGILLHCCCFLISSRLGKLCLDHRSIMCMCWVLYEKCNNLWHYISVVGMRPLSLSPRPQRRFQSTSWYETA